MTPAIEYMYDLLYNFAEETTCMEKLNRSQAKTANGLCYHCSNALDDKRYRKCKRCRDYQKIRRADRIAKGLCPDCGRSLEDGYKKCRRCVDKTLNRKRKRFSQGLCPDCGQSMDNEGKSLCKVCTKRNRDKWKSTSKELINQGLCPYCRQSALPNHKRCYNCLLKSLASGAGVRKQPEELKQKLEDQDYRCIWTGFPIDLGKRASVDHKVPRARNGQDELDNLNWVFDIVNGMKNVLTEDEFIFMIKTIYEHNELDQIDMPKIDIDKIIWRNYQKKK